MPRAMQLGIVRQSRGIEGSGWANPAFIVCAPLSITRVEGGRAWDVSLLVRGIFLVFSFSRSWKEWMGAKGDSGFNWLLIWLLVSRPWGKAVE